MATRTGPWLPGGPVTRLAWRRQLVIVIAVQL